MGQTLTLTLVLLFPSGWFPHAGIAASNTGLIMCTAHLQINWTLCRVTNCQHQEVIQFALISLSFSWRSLDSSDTPGCHFGRCSSCYQEASRFSFSLCPETRKGEQKTAIFMGD